MLTKSDLLSWRQCPRKLWLERNSLPAEENTSLDRRVRDGVRVGEEARKQLGRNLTWVTGIQDRAEASQEAYRVLEEAPDRAGVEVPVVRDDLYVRLDALVPRAGGWVLRETKASGFPLKSDKVTPDKPKAHYLDDVAIQAWALDGSPLRCQAAELNLLDNTWRYPGGGDCTGLFRQMDVTSEIAERRALVPSWVAAAKAIVEGGKPEATTGSHCSTPYDCRFREICKADEPPETQHPLTLLPGSGGKSLARKLAQAGYNSLLEVPAERFDGSAAPLYLRVQRAHREGTYVLEAAAKDAMAAYGYPRYFLDFEGIDFPVPQWQGVRPYEQVPFQFSCHIEREPGVFEHAEHLNVSGEDPSTGFLASLAQSVGSAGAGPIFVWGATYEKTALKYLATRHPEQAPLVEALIGRMVDLIPLVQTYYYHPIMRGSYSIKAVLPTIAPELGYTELDEVQEGTGAQVAYMRLLFDDLADERKRELEGRLRVYCRQDTWAMVEVAHFLAHRPRPVRPRE